jgi:hypothetical protein
MKVFRERAGERDELEERSSQIECKVFSKLCCYILLKTLDLILYFMNALTMACASIACSY